MEKNVLRAIDGIAIYPLISFGIFFLFFLTLLVYVLVVKPDFLRAMAQMPLADEVAPASLPTNPTLKGGTPC